MEAHAREYHAWGVTHLKLLMFVKQHFDMTKFGLGYMFYITFQGSSGDLHLEIPHSRSGFASGV